MDKAKWLELAERCEKATGPDREIDEALALALGWPATVKLGHECLGTLRTVPARVPSFTASLDAITELIEREFSDAAWNVCRDRNGDGSAVLSANYKTPHVDGDGSTPPLALCAAFCRAMAEGTGA